MKKFIFLISLFITTELYSAVLNSLGDATSYKINIRRIELCAAGSVVDSSTGCLNPAIIFDGDSGDIDIASTTAGAAAASLGNASKAVPGITYSTIQVTMERSIKATATVTTKSAATSPADQSCRTSASVAGTHSAGALGHVTNAAAETTLFVGIPETTTSDPNVESIAAIGGTGTAGTFSDAHTFFKWRGTLSQDFTMRAGKLPTVTVAFGTSSAIGFYNAYYGDSTGSQNNDCDTRGSGESGIDYSMHGFYGSEPDISITISY